MSDAAATASRLAAGQWGLLTTAQARRHGISRDQLNHLVAVGILERVEQGVYAAVAAPDGHRDKRVAWLMLAPGLVAEERLADPTATGVLSHTSAAALHQLGDLRDDIPEVTVPRRKQTRRPIRVHRLPLAPEDVTLVEGLPVTTPERTVADLVRDGHDLDHVAHLAGDGLTRGVIDVAVLARRLEPVAHRMGAADGPTAAAKLIEIVGLDAASALRSPAGRDLANIGWTSAIRWILDAVEHTRPPAEDVVTSHRLIGDASAPTVDIAFELMDSPEVRAALDAAASPQFRSTLQWLNSPAGREAAALAHALQQDA